MILTPSCGQQPQQHDVCAGQAAAQQQHRALHPAVGRAAMCSDAHTACKGGGRAGM